MFGLKSIKELPDLPKYKLDSNRQIVIDELEDQESSADKNMDEDNEQNYQENSNLQKNTEAPEPKDGEDNI